jgi:hypothetical protein
MGLNLGLSDDQKAICDLFVGFFARESRGYSHLLARSVLMATRRSGDAPRSARQAPLRRHLVGLFLDRRPKRSSA